MTHLLIRCSSPGLLAEGIKEIRRVYCIGLCKCCYQVYTLSNHLRRLFNLINRELCLVKNEPISMTNLFIRCSSHGLFAEGVKEIRQVYCIGSLQELLSSLIFEQSVKPSL